MRHPSTWLLAVAFLAGPVAAAELATEESNWPLKNVEGFSLHSKHVGIAYAVDEEAWRRNRNRDLTPAPSDWVRNGGGARAFLSFIKEELIPVVDTRYRTNPSDRALSGASYAGLFTLYALFEEPEYQEKIQPDEAYLSDAARNIWIVTEQERVVVDPSDA